MESDNFWHDIIAQWGFELTQTRPDLSITGSPNRTAQRAVLQVTTGDCFVVEAVPLRKRELREKQFQTLDFLSQHNVKAIFPWLPTRSGDMGLLTEGLFWQLRRYIQGDELPRETYANDAWRGTAAATLLADLAHVSQLPDFSKYSSDRFLLKNYIKLLLTQIQHLLPALLDDLKPILDELQEFFTVEEQLPAAFAHGDFHPGNLIWNDLETINALIDWEFCGSKTAGYDAANLLGCIGMDEPAWLTGPMAMSFIRSLREASVLDAQSWHYLPEHIAALRFGWLREWVVQHNKDMICQELDFIWLLLDNRELLRTKWL